MEIGTRIITIVDKVTNEGIEDIKIPAGTVGTVCEIHPEYLLVEIWGESAPKGIEGVFDFNFNEIKEFTGFKKFKKPER